MKNNAPEPLDISADLPGAASTGLVGAWTRFWLAPTSPLGLHWLRFLAGLLFLSWLLPLTGERHALFGLDGYFDVTAYRDASRLPGGPPMPMSWSLLFFFGSTPTLLEIFWWSSIAVLALFTLGVATRITSVLTWLIVVSFLASPASHPDTDFLLVLPAFYLMLGYVAFGQWSRPLAAWERLLGPRGTSVFAFLRGKGDDEPVPSYAANFAVRLFQVHFAIMVVASGLHKLQIDHWWAGVAYWFPLHAPMQMDAAKLDAAKATGNATLFVLTLAEYLALAWQLTFPLFAWRPRLRLLLLGGGAIGMIGAIFLWGEPAFGPLYALGCLSYLTPAEWRWLTDRVSWPLERRAAAPAETRSERRIRVKASI